MIIWKCHGHVQLEGPEQDGYEHLEVLGSILVCMTDKADGSPDISHPVNTIEEFRSVARSHLGSHSLVYAAEIDCIDPNSRGNNKYVELKTSRIIETGQQYENFCKFKLMKWWAQSYLIGITRIVCGFRDDKGVVVKLQDYPVKDLPERAVSAFRKNAWKPAVCFNFLDYFLNFVKSNIKEDNPRCVYLFSWQPGGHVACERRGEDREFLFLPDWFINWNAWDQS
ncbi:decapping and exoribonuclease protein-like [Plakobranchus ocellatus]|uniref:Decapping nuclease n=1 Tax=Plakobranchus ocellatus TaxID=259542 RepID=A0AAV4CKF9_9GAST|nr:decapping and exoribonuclease protein-like [Plakobranchus ocellatus]